MLYKKNGDEMKRTVISIFAIMLLFSSAFSLDTIKVKGNKFVNSNEETVIFRGVNSSDPDKLEKEGMWNEKYFKAVAEWGSNVIRFPVHPRAWRQRTPEQYMQLLDRGVELAKQNNLYVIIDWHSIGNLRQQMFQDPGYETTLDETFEFWRTISKHYSKEPAVAFYELYNEPTITGNRFGNMTWEQWKEIQQNMIQVIRAWDKKTICLAAGFNWAYDLTPVKDSPLTGDNIAYVSHPYPQKREQPWEEKWEADWGFVADHYPVILTEIGFCLENEKGAHIPVISTEDYGKAITAYTEKKGISWVAWVFDTKWAPMLIWDWDFTPTTQGKFFKDYLQSN